MRHVKESGLDAAIAGLALTLTSPPDEWDTGQWVRDHFVTSFQYGDERPNIAGEVEDLFEHVSNEFGLCRVTLTELVEDEIRRSGIDPNSLY